jgi:NAD(P)-dependent dehydrogenase (short-subunit alcohol dehydrogenase family)
MTSGMAYGIFPGASAYSIGKLNNLQLAALVAAENPNVTAIALHPGVVMTDMLAPAFKRFAFDTPELVGGTAVWLATEKAKFLTGRFVGCNWNVDDLYERREEIQSGKLLQIDLTGTFGAEQFK